MVDVVVVFGGPPLITHERLRPREAVVRLAHQLRVRDRQAFHVGRELLRECFECGELFTEVELGPVEEDGEHRLRRARIRDHLRREEEVRVVVGRHRTVVCLAPPAEEEDEAVDGAEGVHLVLVEGPQLVHLHTLHAHLTDHLSEHAGVRLDRAPS